MKKNRLLIVFLFTFIFSSFCASQSFAYSIWRNGGFDPLPAYLYCPYNITEEGKTSISNAFSKWNSIGLGTLAIRSSYVHYIITFPLDNDKNEITKIGVGTNEYLAETEDTSIYGWLGKTYLTETDININISHPLSNSGSPYCYDLQSIMTHETGHVLGLWESSNYNAIMYGFFDLGEIKRNLNQDDINGIYTIYN